MWWFIVSLLHSEHKLQTFTPLHGDKFEAKLVKRENVSWAGRVEVIDGAYLYLWLEIYVHKTNRTKKALWYNIIIDIVNKYICNALSDLIHFNKLEGSSVFSIFQKSFFPNKCNVYLNNINLPSYCLSTHSVVCIGS